MMIKWEDVATSLATWIIIAALTSLAALAVAWWTYIQGLPLPSGAIVAFADAPDGHNKRACSALPGRWEEFLAADGRFILGASQEYKSGDPGGAPTVTLTVDQIPSHQHQIPISGDNDLNNPEYRNLFLTPRIDPAGRLNSDPVHTLSTGNAQPHNNMPPYIALTYCKKV